MKSNRKIEGEDKINYFVEIIKRFSASWIIINEKFVFQKYQVIFLSKDVFDSSSIILVSELPFFKNVNNRHITKDYNLRKQNSQKSFIKQNTLDIFL